MTCRRLPTGTKLFTDIGWLATFDDDQTVIKDAAVVVQGPWLFLSPRNLLDVMKWNYYMRCIDQWLST
jgi:hypothetical protein